MMWVRELVCGIGMVAVLGVTATAIIVLETYAIMGFIWGMVSIFEFMMGAMR